MVDAAALADIRAAYEQPVDWSQDGTTIVGVMGTLFHQGGDDPFGTGGSVRRRGYEVPVALLPFRPRNGDQIVDAGEAWRVIDVVDYEEALAWRVMVERA
jgi:hypothetical protein